jgi:hypothetical protein
VYEHQLQCAVQPALFPDQHSSVWKHEPLAATAILLLELFMCAHVRHIFALFRTLALRPIILLQNLYKAKVCRQFVGLRLQNYAVQITSELTDDFLHIIFYNRGVAPHAQTVNAFADPKSSSHAAFDPHSRMRAGLRFVAQVLYMSGGSVSLTLNGPGHNDGCTVTLKLPRVAVKRTEQPTVVLADGTTSLNDLKAKEANAAINRCLDQGAFVNIRQGVLGEQVHGKSAALDTVPASVWFIHRATAA